MSKLILNDNLKAYHAELAEHIKLLQRNTAYVLDDIVNYDGITLKCTTAGTTNTTKPNISSLSVGSTYTDGTCVWTRVDLDKRGIDYYESAKDYVVDDQVVYDNKIYKCITAHTSTSTFDDTKWAEISAGGSGGISVWQANTAYNVNDVVIDSNLIWQCATAHTSTSTFDESKWVCISGGEISNGLEVLPLWEGSYSFSNSTQGAEPTSSTTMIELTESLDDFQVLLFEFGLDTSGNTSDYKCGYFPVSRKTTSNTVARLDWIYDTGHYVTAAIWVYDSTHLYIRDTIQVGGFVGAVFKVSGIRKAKPIVSSGMKYETLWEGEAGSLSGSGSTTINLSEPVTRYKKLGLSLVSQSASGYRRSYYQELDTNILMNLINSGSTGDSIQYGFSGNTSYYFEIGKDSNVSQLSISYGHNVITKVTGISEGVVVPTGVQAAKVTLWEGQGTQGQTLTLSDDYSNYDLIIMYSSDAQDAVLAIGQIEPSKELTCFSSYYNGTRFINVCDFSNNTATVTYAANMYVKRIVGIKYIQPDSYSTEEKLIGTWIDGKPLYRKVFENSSLSLSTGLSSDSYKITRLTGFCNFGGNYVNIPYNYSGLYIVQYMSVSSGIITTASSNPSEISDYTIIVEYTKN